MRNKITHKNRYIFYCKNMSVYTRNPQYLDNHPEVTNELRNLIIKWLAAFCEQCELHRQTFYLSIDYFDRLMSNTRNIPASSLQLVAATCLLIACKFEETQISIMDGLVACSVEDSFSKKDIIKMEVSIADILDWSFFTATPIGVLDSFLETIHTENYQDSKISQKCLQTYLEVVNLIDCCISDISSLNFSYETIVASALCYVVYPNTEMGDLFPCIKWMAPFYVEAQQKETLVKDFHTVPQKDMHNIQTKI